MIKPLAIAIVGLLVGIAGGWFLHARITGPAAETRATMQRTLAGSCQATVVSLAALSAIERGDVADAKHRLASQIASYEHTFSDYDGALPDCPKLKPLITSTAEHSDILRQELAKNGTF